MALKQTFFYQTQSAMTISKLNPVFSVAFLSATLLFLFTACKKDVVPGATGQLNVEITDGPIDDPSVKGVFITVADVQINGHSFHGFSGKKTINLLDFQQGKVQQLGVGNLDVSEYQNITLVLDPQTDASGNSPGCYVLTDDNLLHPLTTTNYDIEISTDFDISEGQRTDLVIDFDVRKAIQYQDGGADRFDFVTASELQSAVRVLHKNTTGNIAGTCQNAIINADKIIAYVYKKGDYDREVEMDADNGITFKNAVTSAVVGSDDKFRLAFLEAGQYELHFGAYKVNDNNGQSEMLGTLLLESAANLETIRLDANSEVQLEIVVIGILP
jgi:hypothetical protein